MSADDELKDWLIGPGRLSGDGVAIAEGYVRRLAAAGVPLSRARFAQRLANPLLSAWGIIWTPEETTEYTVAREILETGAWLGSPFQQVVTDRSMLHKSLIGAGPGQGPHHLPRACRGRRDGPFSPWRWNMATARRRAAVS